MTGALEQFLRRMHAERTKKTLAGIGPGGWDSKALANAQGQATATSAGKVKTIYRLYTEDVNRNRTIATVKRYFDGATLLYGIGLDARTQFADENAVVIEIVSSKTDALQRVLDLAGDLRENNAQISILITRHDVHTFEVTETSPTQGTL